MSSIGKSQPFSDNGTSTSQEPQPHQDQPMVSTLMASASSSRDGATHDAKSLSPDSARQPEFNPEDGQNQPFSHSELEEYDPDCARRVLARTVKPLLSWESDSMEYLTWFKMRERNNPPPTTEILEKCEPSANITLPLLGFQKEWLRWGLYQEASRIKGGILNDEWGLGKTIQAISLVVTARDLNLLSKPEVSCSSSGRNNRCTLVICHDETLRHWKKEIEKHTVEESVRVLVFDGENKPTGKADFSEYDFVITTYRTVRSDYQIEDLTKKKAKRTTCTNPVDICVKSPLSSPTWERIILDDANIKDKKSIRAKAIFRLESEYKWVLTGCPLQNALQEINFLIRFLQVKPYSSYICLDCNCQKQDPSPLTGRHCCVHANSRHITWWNKYIANQINRTRPQDASTRAKLLLNEKVLKSTLLRRTKSEITDYTFPPKIIRLRKDSMDERECVWYKELIAPYRIQVQSYIQAGKVMRNHARILDMLTRLQQSTSCEHYICKSCWDRNRRWQCPTCHTFLTEIPEKKRNKSKVEGFKCSSILNRLPILRTSTKIEALNEEIRNMIEDDGSTKGIVFSPFIDFLDLIGYWLRKNGVKWVKLEGSMSIKERDKAITAFNDDAHCKILLMTSMAGVVDHNLTVASYVFLMDPCWTSAAEKQVLSRIHRIGQCKPVRIIRFAIEDTVDECILKLQSRMDEAFDRTYSDSQDVVDHLTEEELSAIFEI